MLERAQINAWTTVPSIRPRILERRVASVGFSVQEGEDWGVLYESGTYGRRAR